MNREQLLAGVLAIEAEHPTYRLGGSATDGTCDCIGLVIGALRRGGVSWPGTHGTNWAARRAVTGLRQVTSAAQLSPGELVFKSRAPGEAGYALPATYAGDADRRDYYHVGVVLRVSPLVIVHCTVPTVKRDTRLGAWRHAASLSLLTEDAPETTPDTAPSAPDAEPTLRRGDRGEAVTRMQTLLLSRGESLPRFGADGIFGGETERALRRLQAARGLQVDGICGPLTWNALRKEE